MNIQTPIVRDPKQEKFDTRSLLAHARQQAEDRRYEDFMIIDVDSHHYETGSYKEIFEYIDDPVMRDNFIYSKAQTLHPRSTGGYQEMAGRITRYQHRATEPGLPDAPHRDIGLTRKWMDSMGSTSPACSRRRCWGSASIRWSRSRCNTRAPTIAGSPSASWRTSRAWYRCSTCR